MSIQVTPIPRLTVLTVPGFTLGVANAAGSATSAVASDSTLLAFDTTLPDAITFGQSGAVGSATVSSRRDHAHAMASEEGALATSVTTFTRSAAAGSGDVSYTGAGFVPTGVIIGFVNDTGGDSIGIGFIDSGATDEASSVIRGLGGTPITSTNADLVISSYNGGASAGQTAIAKSLDADGITLTWTKVGAGQSSPGVIYYLR